MKQLMHTKRVIAAGAIILFLLTSIWSLSLYRASLSNCRQTLDQCLEAAIAEELRIRLISLGNNLERGYIPYSDTSTFVKKTIQTGDTVFDILINKNDPSVMSKVDQYILNDFLPVNVDKLDILFRRCMFEHSLNTNDCFIEFWDLKKKRLIADDAPTSSREGYTESGIVALDILDSIGIKAYTDIPLFAVMQPFTMRLVILALLTLAELCCLFGLLRILIRQYKEKRKLMSLIVKVSREIEDPIRTSTVKIDNLSEQLTLNNWIAAAESADQVAGELNRVSFYVDEVLAIIQSEERPAIFAKEFLPIRPVFEELKKRYEQTVGKKVSVRLETDKDAVLYTNAIHFRNVMNALMSNAIRFSNDTVNIELKTFCVDKLRTIVVKDNGWGIPQADCEQVFRKFYRVKSHEERLKGNKGHGLGLSYVKATVCAMGGDIIIDSEENKSTEAIMIFSNDPSDDGESPYFAKHGKTRMYKSRKDMRNYFSSSFALYNWELIELQAVPKDGYYVPYDPSIISIVAKPKNEEKASPLPFFIFEYYYDVRYTGSEDGLHNFVLIKNEDPYRAEQENYDYAKYMQQRNSV